MIMLLGVNNAIFKDLTFLASMFALVGHPL